MWTLLSIFLGAIALDILQGLYVRYVAAGQRLRATLISAAVTFCSFLLWATILKDVETFGLSGVLTLASGSAVGTLVSTRGVRK